MICILLNVSVQQIYYSNQYIGTKYIQTDNRTYLPILNAPSIEIDTVEELINVQSNNHYVLMTDLDLDGMNWTGIETFRGIFDGNNHTISNLTSVDTFDKTMYYGLFKEAKLRNSDELEFREYQLYRQFRN